jgi:murein DD-endopeptidase MepM/ murein hydrolase activator NlpD
MMTRYAMCRALPFLLILAFPLLASAGEITLPQGGVMVIPPASIAPQPQVNESDTFPHGVICTSRGCSVIIGIDLTTPPGPYRDIITRKGEKSETEEEVELLVTPGHFPEQKLSLPKKYVEPEPEDQTRIDRERALIRQALASIGSGFATPPFQRPVSGRISTYFGMKRVLNGKPRSQHYGIDISVPRGTPVKAMASGRIMLTGDFFYNGKSVFVDHGGGIASMYFHLDEIQVTEGQQVTSGQTIGLVGSTGRSTGPHLHFGVKIRSATIDPFTFIEATQQLAAP